MTGVVPSAERSCSAMELPLRPYGERGLLLHDLSDGQRARCLRELEKERPPGCLEYVVGQDSLLFLFREPVDRSIVQAWWAGFWSGEGRTPRPGPLKRVPVVYDGPDLDEVARKTGLSVEEVIDAHCKPVYTVRMLGFTPGFPYLDGLDPRLQIPRKAVPLKRIEPGTVAIGGPHAGIYSVASPGGWHLLGQTSIRLFDPAAASGERPEARAVFFFAPGDRVQFEPVI